MHCESGFGFDIKDDFEKNRKGHSNMKNYRAELTGVFGDPVDDNPTGVVEEAAFAAKNLNYRYLTIKVLPEDLGKAMRSKQTQYLILKQNPEFLIFLHSYHPLLFTSLSFIVHPQLQT